ARYLDGSAPEWEAKASGRALLADWILQKENPYFHRTIVNRLWGHLFGIGLIDPVDEFNKNNQPSHPELLSDLIEEFVKHEYDVKFLLAAIACSETYQRSSATSDPVD